jgi:two-component system cell cycle response regulator DivK
MKPRILIVNGTPNDLVLGTIALELAGYDVSLAAGVQQALAALTSDIPDLILVDISGPDTDGPALMPLLKADPKLRDVPVVALTTAARPLDNELAPDPGYIGHVTKPIDSVEFPKQVAAFMRATCRPRRRF